MLRAIAVARTELCRSLVYNGGEGTARQEDISRIDLYKCIFYKYGVSNTNGCRETVGNVVKLLGNLLPNKTIGGWWDV